MFNRSLFLNTQVGKNLKILYSSRYVIGNKVIVGDNVTISRQVILRGRRGNIQKHYPIIKDYVNIYSGAKNPGNLVVNEKSVIGAILTVFKDTPMCLLWQEGVPARVIRYESN